MKTLITPILLVALTTPAVAQMRGPADGAGPGRFEVADANRDGVVTRAEFQTYRMQVFDRLDRNRDGVVSPADFPRLASARPQLYRHLTQALEGADTNNDGVVSKDELAHAPMRLFDRVDTNHDDRVTTAEAQAMRDRVQNLRETRGRR